ncbi:MAG: ParB N-terminal domain-containing protein [Leifsonia sp.]
MTTNTAIELGHVEHVDPNLIIIEANVRPGETMKPITKEFVATIRDHGVMEPVIGYRDEHGNTIVRMGQRRTLGAREAGVATIPVYLVNGDSTDTAKRIVEQLVENDHRTDLTEAQRADAWQQLAFEGMSVATIAKRTGAKQATVKAGLAVVDNGTAASAIAAHDLTLDQAATLIEFDGDDETVNALIEVATEDPAQFAHAAQRARDERRLAKIKADATADLIERGYEILDRDRGYYETDYISIRELTTKDGEPVTVEAIAEVEGRAAFVRTYFTSEEADERYFLKDPKAAGFRKSSGSGATSGPMTDDEKAERKTLIANNKAWASAEVVRREWLAEFLSRKTLPKDTAQVIAQGLTMHRRAVGSAATDGNTLAHALLGIERGGYWDADKLVSIVEHTPGKAQHVSLAVVLGGIEASTSKNTWRHPGATYARYFEHLAVWGYGLSEVEQIVVTAAAPSEAVEAEQEDTETDAE